MGGSVRSRVFLHTNIVTVCEDIWSTGANLEIGQRRCAAAAAAAAFLFITCAATGGLQKKLGETAR
jgi:hypothetical protein